MKVSEISKRFHGSLNHSSSSNSLSRNDEHSGRSDSRKILNPRRLSVGIGLSAVLIALMLLPSIQGPLSHRPAVIASDDNIDTFAPNDCTTPKSTWNLGETACAVATTTGRRSIVWTAPNGNVAQRSAVFAGSGSDSYAIPTTGSFAQVGTWSVRSVNVDGDSVATANFVVRNATVATADLSITKSGPAETSAGALVNYVVSAYNLGPDAAQNVRVTDATPANTTFVSATQNSGPAFTCATLNGVTTCTGASLAAGDNCSFTFLYTVNGGTPDNTVISNTATVASDTTEPQSQSSDDSATTQATVTTASASPCTIGCPGDITRSNDPQAANPCAVVVTYTTPTASGNCTDSDTGTSGGAVTCSPPSGAAFPVGTTPVTCNNGAFACSFNVIVNETRQSVQPTISCPSDMTVPDQPTGSGFATVTFAPTVTGNCANSTCSPPSGSSFAAGTTPVNCTATDPSGQSASCSFNVTVTSPTGGCALTCPPDVTQTAASGQCSAVVTYSAPTTNGNCSTVTCDPPSGSTFQSGTTAVTCTSSGGPSCGFTVTVNASASPTITTCATDKTLTANSNCEAPIPNLVPEVQTTGCNVTVTQSPAAGTIVGPGAATVTLTAENSAGEAHCTATVTVLTPAPPTISCPADAAKSNDAGQCGAVVSYPAPTGNSPCPGLTFSCSPASGSFFPIGATNVTCTARDASGQTATCTFKVTVNDTQPPTISCPASVTKSNDQDKCSAVVNYASPTVADNCPGVTSSCTPASGTAFALGTTTVTCTATDESNNTATCSFTVTVNDTQAPTFTCPSNIQVGTDPNSATATVNYNPTVSDNCPGAVTVVCTPASGSQFHLGTTAVTCTATDAANNQSSCSFNVTVLDSQPPTISCPGSRDQSNDPNQCGAVVDYPPPTVTDNEPGATAACSPPSHSFFPVGTTVVTCTATDVGGNHSSCSFTVTVRDAQPPTIVCPPNKTASNTPGQCSANVNPGTAVAADNCPTGVTVGGSRSDGLALTAPYPVGTTTITWTARDAAGNQASCTQTIVVSDTQAPTITGAAANPSTLWPPNHRMVDVAINYTVTDNCTPSSQVVCTLSVTSNEGTSADWVVVDAHHVQLRADRNGGGNGRTYTITITCRDSGGNTSTGTVTVTVPHNQ